MIYKSGKEIKEIYIGDTSVTAVYIGNKLVWRSYVYFKTTGTEIYIPQSDTELLRSHGITYSLENTSLSFTAHASPYMRHIAPMLAENQAVGNAEGLLKVSHSEVAEAADSALLIHNAGAVSAKSADDSVSHIDLAVHENSVTPSPGSVMPFTVSGSPFSEVNITGGTGEAPRDMYISESVQCIPIVHGDGETIRPTHVSEAQAAVSPANGGGKVSEIQHIGTAEYDIRTMYADGKHKNTGDHTAQAFQMIGRALKASIDLPKGAAEWTASAKAESIYAGTQKYGEESSLLQICAVFGEKSGSQTASLSSEYIPSHDITAKSSTGNDVAILGITFGSCSASMTTEIFEEPQPTEFDTMSVADIDVLTVADIDTMMIKL